MGKSFQVEFQSFLHKGKSIAGEEILSEVNTNVKRKAKKRKRSQSQEEESQSKQIQEKKKNKKEKKNALEEVTDSHETEPDQERRKKKKKKKSKEQSDTEKFETNNESENASQNNKRKLEDLENQLYADRDIQENEINGEERRKKKKKKKKKIEETVEQPHTDIDIQEDGLFDEERRKKKKKKKRKFEESSEGNSSVHYDSEKNEMRREKKKKNKSKEKDESQIDADIFEAKSDEERRNEKKKKKRKLVDDSPEQPDEKTEMWDETALEPEENVLIKREALDVETDESVIPKEELVEQNMRIKDLYQMPRLYEVTEDIMTACEYILKENVPVSPLNVAYTGNSVPPKVKKKELRARFQAKFGGYFTEQDDMILKRFRDLMLEVGSDGKEFLESVQEKCSFLPQAEVKMHKKRKIGVRNIIGLYVGQDIPHKIAFTHYDRLIKLVLEKSMRANYVPVVEKKARRSPRWTMKEDKSMIKQVLLSTPSVEKISDLNSQTINWDEIAASKQVPDRTAKMLREHWQRSVYPALVDDVNARSILLYKKQLLEAILAQNVPDRKEINWDELEQMFKPRPRAMLVSLKLIEKVFLK